MTKIEFLLQLEKQLAGLPEADLLRTMDYYNEIIDDRAEDMGSETEAVAAMGTPEDIAAQVLSEFSLPKLVKEKIKPRRRMAAWEIVLLCVGVPIWLSLLIAAFAVIISLYVVVFSVVVTLFATSVAAGAVALGGIVTAILAPLRNDYDYIIVDTGPKLDNLSINALVAADQLIIPVNPQFLSTAGLDKLHGTIRKIKRRLNPNVKIAGILLTMCETRTNLCKIICQQIREEYETAIPVFENAIPMTVKVGEAVYYSKPVLDYAPNCSASIAYKNFAKELDKKMNHIVPIQLHKLTFPANDFGKAVKAL